MQRITMDIQKQEFYAAVARMGIVLDTEEVLALVQAFVSLSFVLDGYACTIVGYEERDDAMCVILVTQRPSTQDDRSPPGTTFQLPVGATIRATVGGVIEYCDAQGAYRRVPENTVLTYDRDTVGRAWW